MKCLNCNEEYERIDTAEHYLKNPYKFTKELENNKYATNIGLAASAIYICNSCGREMYWVNGIGITVINEGSEPVDTFIEKKRGLGDE